MFKYLILIYFLVCFQVNLEASELCVHPQICNLITRIHPKLKPTLAFTIVGDHHHFEPSSDAIKKLITTSKLYHGPISLHPWLKTVLRQRKLNSNVTNIGFEIDKSFFQIYPRANDEVLAHFWLYPEMNCLAEIKIQNQILKEKNEHLFSSCMDEYKNSLDKMQKEIKKLNLPIVLTHDAFLPLLDKLEAKTITLKGSHHHEEIDIKSVKSLYQETKNKKVIWIFEKGFTVPPNILNLVKKTDFQIEINTDGELNQGRTGVLDSLTLKLSKLNQ